MTDTVSDKPEIDISRHEQEYQLKRDDTFDIALLANVVGRELTQVDKNAVAGSFKKATQINQQKIFANTPVDSRQSVSGLTKVNPPTQNVTHVNPPSSPPAPKQISHTTAPLDLSPVLQKLDNLEKKLSAIESIYTTIIDRLTSSSNQITLTIDNDQNR